MDSENCEFEGFASVAWEHIDVDVALISRVHDLLHVFVQPHVSHVHGLSLLWNDSDIGEVESIVLLLGLSPVDDHGNRFFSGELSGVD